ncbi:uncharacterized protein TRUGW13939_09455 [Talaromyces rugulosus]|uniref:Ubiquitin-like domain-containing protein n=1 Tax=Talaromyces rugulosus TaxID=121627 RepID=A0A7H8R7T8_TALRU|nr:uncharacterized protein TRUGW13939_09455 [Talaromyces rugulosus]QKX62296.1 hypothetical protein TRUGW13939_09455 [Talaromyces rugulosus]
MPAGFSFSVGDFFAVLKLVDTVIDALRESPHSSSWFHALINELYALETALLRVKRLLSDIDGVEKAALQQVTSQCQRTIGGFYENVVRKNQPHLQQGCSNSRLKDAWAAVKWTVFRKEGFGGISYDNKFTQAGLTEQKNRRQDAGLLVSSHEIPSQVQRQQPIYLIDPFNMETPFHLEFVRSSEALLAVLKVNLKKSGCGPAIIDRGQFVIEELGTQSSIDLAGPWETCFYPGQRVAMSMIFKQQHQTKSSNSSCPRCGKDHEESTSMQITCTTCGTVFRRIQELIENTQTASPSSRGVDTRDTPENPVIGLSSTPRKRKRGEEDEDDDLLTNLKKFRRIQLISRCFKNQEDLLQHVVNEHPTIPNRIPCGWDPHESFGVNADTAPEFYIRDLFDCMNNYSKATRVIGEKPQKSPVNGAFIPSMTAQYLG